MSQCQDCASVSIPSSCSCTATAARTIIIYDPRKPHDFWTGQYLYDGRGMVYTHGTRAMVRGCPCTASRTRRAARPTPSRAGNRERNRRSGAFEREIVVEGEGKGEEEKKRSPAANIGRRGLFPRRPCPSFELALMKCSLISRGRVSSAPCARRVRRSRVFDPECGSANAGYCP